MFGFIRAYRDGKSFEQTYKNALTVIMARFVEELKPEQLAYAVTFYTLGITPSSEGLHSYMLANRGLVDQAARLSIDKDANFRDLVAATATVAYAQLRAKGRVIESNRVLESYGFSLGPRPEHISASGFKALVDEWGRRAGFVE